MTVPLSLKSAPPLRTLRAYGHRRDPTRSQMRDSRMILCGTFDSEELREDSECGVA
jgi:hypothetical protein